MGVMFGMIRKEQNAIEISNDRKITFLIPSVSAECYEKFAYMKIQSLNA